MSRRRGLLRSATAELHEAAEAAVEAAALFGSRDGYGLFLRRSLRFHSAFEPAA